MSDDGSPSCPQRYIYTQADMDLFRESSARKELLSFVTAMGRGLLANSDFPHCYDPTKPLWHLTPALASLHGSLSYMAATWLDGSHTDGIPPDLKAKARFGNPAFRRWHARLVDRSYNIVMSLMDCHCKYSQIPVGEDQDFTETLANCAQRGYRAASSDGALEWPNITEDFNSNQQDITNELRAYFNDSFGHPIRIDYGTGHESSFVVFLLALCKQGYFQWTPSDTMNKMDGQSYFDNLTKPTHSISFASLSLFHVYLTVTRGLQRDYMLEPAGSHGVWGLDDYHCIPFYLGACQMMAREQWQRQQQLQSKHQQQANQNDDESQGNSATSNPYLSKSKLSTSNSITTTSKDDLDHWGPSIIHNRQTLEAHQQTYLYFSCIHFIQQIKPNVPFFESSPMLNDISSLGTWTKVASGLLRLYKGEVLDKLPVVQHFVFGKIFRADWTPSRKGPMEAPQWTFVNGPMGEECIAPWAYYGSNGDSVNAASSEILGTTGQERRDSNTIPSQGMAPTRAPWAK